MNMPKGCKNSLQISFISDEKLRPHPESKWLYEYQLENGATTTGVTTSLETAIEKSTIVFA
jgi:hypothetical protein